ERPTILAARERFMIPAAQSSKRISRSIQTFRFPVTARRAHTIWNRRLRTKLDICSASSTPRFWAQPCNLGRQLTGSSIFRLSRNEPCPKMTSPELERCTDHARAPDQSLEG